MAARESSELAFRRPYELVLVLASWNPMLVTSIKRYDTTGSMYTVTKEFKFDSAHRLINGYQGKCKNIHGHTWKARFEVCSNELNQFGFVWDFGDFKTIKEFIDNELDHAMIISIQDMEMRRFCLENEQKHFCMDNNPTSENIAHLLFDKAWQHNIPVIAVEVDETCTCRARFTPVEPIP